MLPYIAGGTYERKPNGSLEALGDVVLEFRSPDHSTQVKTSAQGRYKVSVPHGNYDITGYLPGYMTEKTRVIFKDGEKRTVNLFLEPSDTQVLPAGISGRIYAKHSTVKVLKNASIAFLQGGDYQIVNSDSQGNYQVKLSPGKYKVFAWKDGYVAKALDLGVNDGNEVLNIILDGNQEVSQETNGVSVRLSRTAERPEDRVLNARSETSGDYVCRVRQRRISASFNDNLLLDPTSDVIWPGAILDGSSIASGEYRPIAADRAPLTISISLENIQKDSHRIVEEPALSTVRNASNYLRRQVMEGAVTPARLQYESTEIHSTSDLQLKLGGHYNGVVHKLSTSFDLSSSSTTNKRLVKFQQRYYTLDVDPPNQPEDFFSSRQTFSGDEMYVGSVTYGRMLLYTFESHESEEKLEAAIEYAFKGTGGASADVKHTETLKNTKINILVLGGAADAGIQTITEGVAGIEKYIKQGANYSAASPGVPLAYKLRFISDNTIGNLVVATNFYERNCTKTTGRFKLTVTALKCTKVQSDEGGNVEIYGNIWIKAFAKEGELITVMTVWNKGSKNYASLRKDKYVPINQGAQFIVEDFHKLRDLAYIEVGGRLKERDPWSSDDNFGTRTKRVYLREAASDPNKDPDQIKDEDEAEADPGRTLYFSRKGTHLEVWFEVEPVQ